MLFAFCRRFSILFSIFSFLILSFSSLIKFFFVLSSSSKINSLDNLTEISERSTFHTVKNACEWRVERCVPNFILIFVEYVNWNLLKFLKLKLSLLWIFIVLDEKNIYHNILHGRQSTSALKFPWVVGMITPDSSVFILCNYLHYKPRYWRSKKKSFQFSWCSD